jgi:hypothetical protein
MAYDEGKDKLIQDFEHEDGLHVGVYSYDEGDHRVQIGPRTYRTQSGELRYAKVGRLSQAELAWLCEFGKVILTMPRPSPKREPVL